MGSPLEQLMLQNVSGETYSVFAGVSRYSEPAKEPISLADARLWLKMDDIEDDDVIIESLLVAARIYIEERIKRSLITQQWRLILNGFPSSDNIELPFGQIQTVDSIKSYDEDNTLTEFDSSYYSLGSISNKVFLNDGYTWPTDLRRNDSVEIIYTAGYGSNPGNVPYPIKQAIYMLVAHWYENRSAGVVGSINQITKLGVDSLLSQYVKRRL